MYIGALSCFHAACQKRCIRLDTLSSCQGTYFLKINKLKQKTTETHSFYMI